MKRAASARGKAWPPALVCVLLGLGWQLLTVHFNYGGNFTALFCTSRDLPIPPQLADEHIYVFPQGGGYDGEYYHYVAHDPLYRNGIGRAIGEAAAMRYRRILIPGLAYLLAFGQQRWIDAAYFACNLAFLFLGAWWLAQWLMRYRLNAWFAVLYLLVPSTLISLDRMVIDLALTSLCLGFMVYLKPGSGWKLLLVAALAALCRDTGFFLAIGCAVVFAAQRRFRECLAMLAALVPALAWFYYVDAHIAHQGFGVPGFTRGLIDMFWAYPYPFAPALRMALVALDRLEAAGLLLAVAIGLAGWRKAAADPMACACLLWSITGLMLPPQEMYSGARILSPLMLVQFLETYRGGWSRGWKIGRAPMLMTVPRIVTQLAPQAWGVIRGLL